MKWIKYVLGSSLIVLGVLGLVEMLLHGYDPANKDIMLYSEPFRQLFNSLMKSIYIPILVRVIQIVAGCMMLTKKYSYLGSLLHLPISINILAMHLLFDLPPAHISFFIIGMWVSLSNIYLVASDWKKLRLLVLPD